MTSNAKSVTCKFNASGTMTVKSCELQIGKSCQITHDITHPLKVVNSKPTDRDNLYIKLNDVLTNLENGNCSYNVTASNGIRQVVVHGVLPIPNYISSWVHTVIVTLMVIINLVLAIIIIGIGFVALYLHFTKKKSE